MSVIEIGVGAAVSVLVVFGSLVCWEIRSFWLVGR